MRRLMILVTLGALVAASAALACGPGNDKPPLTPDTEQPAPEIADGGDPAPEPPNPVAD